MLGVSLCICPWVDTTNQSSVEEVLCQIAIPRIDLDLPVYEGTEEETLEKGVGHIPWSGPLAGGDGTHCLLAAHRGLPGSQMFLRLHELEEGDFFYLRTQSEVRSYRVCQTRVVRPEQTEEFIGQQTRELVSLITCTPYGIHTHRLVVTGERIKGKE